MLQHHPCTEERHLWPERRIDAASFTYLSEAFPLAEGHFRSLWSAPQAWAHEHSTLLPGVVLAQVVTVANQYERLLLFQQSASNREQFPTLKCIQE